MKTSSSIICAVCIAALALLSSSCTKSGIQPNPNPDTDISKSLKLAPYENCEQMEREIKEMLTGEMEKNADGLTNLCRYEGDMWPLEPIPVQENGDEAYSSPGATRTNLQEIGVDEADLIKTDGKYAYAITGDKVLITRVWPFAEFGKSSEIVPSGMPLGLYLWEDYLIILSGVDTLGPDQVGCASPEALSMGCVIPDYRATTIEEVYDISNPSKPTLVKKNTYSGKLLQSRRIKSNLYLIQSDRGVAYPNFSYDLGIDYEDLPACSESGESTPTGAMLDAIERIKEENRKLIESLSIEDLLPALSGGTGLECTDILHSESAVGASLLSIHTDLFNSATASPSKIAMLSNGGTVYASKNAIYVTSSKVQYGWWTMPSYEFEDSTVIHRFALESGMPEYSASAEISGHLLDNGFAGSRYSMDFSMAQFAISEHEGYLRIATTVDSYSEAEAIRDNRVVVLDIKDSKLAKVGEVKGMGLGEKIHAVRFIGDMAYVVTFKKTDPLYVVDISDPFVPHVAGELHIPGFSTYLHPLDQNHLIGLGFGADDMGDFAWTQGLKLSLFDVSDPANPAEIGNREIGSRGSYSPAVEEHHAFTLESERGMLALPVDLYEGGTGGSDYGNYDFSGVILLKVDTTGTFSTLGSIKINQGTGESPNWWDRPPNMVKRTVIIGDGIEDGILTLTTEGIMLNLIDDGMSLVGNVN